MTRAIGAILLASVLAGCTVGPDYQLPADADANAPAANGPFISGDDAALVLAPLPDHWWRLYDDARLDGYVMEALAANTDLRAADANLRRATAAIREAKSAQTISTSIQSSVTDADANGIDILQFQGFSYSLGVGVAYPLDLAGGIRRAIEVATASAEAVQAVRDDVRVTVAAAVARNYAAACSANRSLAAAENVVDIQRETLDEVERLFHGGRNTAFDVTRAKAAVDQSIATIPPIIAQRQAALYALAALMGRPVAKYPRELESCPAPPDLRRPLPIGDGTDLIRRRSDIRAAERSLAAATAAIGVETAQLYPQVSIGGAIGIASPFSTLGSITSLGGNVGPLMSWTFPNISQADARIAEAGAGAEAAAARFDGVVLTALQQTESALDAYVREIEHNRDLRLARDTAAQATAQAMMLFRFGRTDILDVLTVEATLAAAETAVAASDAALADDLVSVFLALGGGWES